MEVSTSGVQVLDRALTILYACEEGPATLAELMERTGLARATAHRLAMALEESSLLHRDAAGRWSLGPTLARLGAAASAGPPLAVVARPSLERLRDATGESVQLYIRRGAERLCVVSLESPHSLRTIVPVGAALPLDRGSAGKVLLGPVPTGWAQSVEEREPGVASVSAPVRDMRIGAVAAAVSVSGPIERLSRSPGRRYGSDVVRAAHTVELAAGLSG